MEVRSTRSLVVAAFPPAGSVRHALYVAAIAMLGAWGCSAPTGPGDGSIRGIVTDNAGATVANAGVALSGNAQATRTTASSADGVYTFAALPPGTYTLAVTPPAGFTVGTAGTMSVNVVSGAQASASVFVLNRVTVANGSIRGTVTDNAGATVVNAGVALSGNAQPVRTTKSGPDGVYTFADLPPGTYTLAVTPPAGFTVGVAGTTSVTVTSAAQASASAFVLIRVPPTNGSVRGIVTDNASTAVANAAVELTGNGQPARTATTGCNGVYSFADLPHGTYTLAVAPPAGFTSGAVSTTTLTIASGAQADAAVLRVNRPAGESAFVTALRGRLATATTTDAFSGAVLVTRNEATVFEGACGMADREQGIANTLTTKFRVGSMNKMLTAVAVLQLVQAGKVSLHAPFGTYLPGYPNAEMASKVTLHHLLTHTGGTGDIFGPQFTANRLQLRDIEDYLNLYRTRALQFEPGTQHVYSNYGFILLGAVIERVSGMTYDEYIATHVLAPAGMTGTGAAPEDVVVPGRSFGYTWQGGVLTSNASLLPYRGTSAGGWYSTVEDFARFATALREHRLLDPTHTALLVTGKVPIGQSTVVQYAYGFMDRFQVGRRLVGHGGSYPGMNGELTFEPGGGYTIVILSNYDPQAATLIEFFILSNLPPN